MATASIEIIADSSQVRTATRDLKALQQQGAPVQAAANGATKAMGGFGASAGRAGIQISQLTGQIQGGTNGFIALSQQAQDIGFVLGAPLIGVIVSLGAALAFTLTEAAKSAGGSIETLDDAVKRLGDAVLITDDGVALLTREIEKLAAVSRTAAMAQLAQEIIDAKGVITSSVKEINEAFGGVTNAVELAEDAFALYRQAVDDGTASQEGLTLSVISVSSPIFRLQQLILQLSDELKISTDQSLGLASALYDVRESGSPAAIQALQITLAELNKETGFSNEKLVKFASKMSEAFTETRNAGEIIKAAEGFLNNFDVALEQSTESTTELADKTQRLVQQLTIQNMELKGARLEAALYAAALSTGKKSADDLDLTVKQLVVDNFNLAESKRAAADAAKAQSAAQKELLQELRAEQDEMQKARATAAKFDETTLSLAAQGNPVEAARQQLQARLDVIREYSQLETADRESALQAQFAAEQLYQKAISDNAIAEQKKRTEVISSQLSSAQDFFGILAEIAKSGGEESFLLYKRLAQGQAVVAGSLAIIKALAEGGPIAGPVLASAMAGLVGAQIAVIERQQFSGSRATGGSVYGGNSYLVGERGPEMFTPNASGGGTITPFSQLMNEQRGGGTNVVVNVQNNAGGQVDVQRRQGPNRSEIIDIVVADIQGRGRVQRAITNTTTASNRI